jgi:serine/threonine protein kinase
MAPEVLRRTGHNHSADIWSFGCLIIEMVSGKPPWTVTGAKFSEILGYISSGVHPPFPNNLSKELSSLLEICLNPIPAERWTAGQLMKHKFFDRKGGGSDAPARRKSVCK